MQSLVVQNLNKVFKGGLFEKDKLVLKNVNFQVEKGVTTGFVGVNGSGKTTSLKCVLGFIHPTSGGVHFFENQILSSEIKNKIGYMPERPYFYEFLKAEEFLKFHWDLGGGGPGFEVACNEVLGRVNLLSAKKTVLRKFSKGMLQRVGLAQAIIKKPEFLILDEPMSGLDPDGRFLIKKIMKEEQARGTTIFFSSHLLHDMEELCRDIVVIDQGQIIYQGELKKFLNFSEGETLDLELAFQRFRENQQVQK